MRVRLTRVDNMDSLEIELCVLTLEEIVAQLDVLSPNVKIRVDKLFEQTDLVSTSIEGQ